MVQKLDKYGNTSIDNGKVIVVDKYGVVKQPSSGGGGSPTGPAGGDLSGTYPNPSVVWTNGESTYNSVYFAIPTGTTSQYIRGDGSLAPFPSGLNPTLQDVTDNGNETTNAIYTAGFIFKASGVEYIGIGNPALNRYGLYTADGNKNIADIDLTSPSSAVYRYAEDKLVVTDTTFTYEGVQVATLNDIPTVGTWGALNYPTWTTGTPFVKMTAAGTFALDTNNYITSPLTTKGDIFVRNASADTRLPIGLDTQVLIADSTQATGMKWGSNTAATPTGYYGAWQDNVTQTAAVSNIGYPMIFRTTDLSNGVSIVTNGTSLTRITFANTGIYNLQFSSQFQNNSNQLADVSIWLRLNGVDVAGSSGYASIPNSHGGVPGHSIVSWNYLLSVVAGQYYELVWSTSDATNVTMQYYAAGNPPPSTASVILTVTQQSGIMAGTGITAINGLTGDTQTLTTGTLGTDFTISSSGTTHTFNLPTASSTNRGALSSADWTTFNTAYTDRLKWDGGSTGLVAATGRTSLGATTVGGNLFTLTNPSAITFIRVNADNTISTLDASTFRTAIGAGTSSTNGTVTSVSALTLGTSGTDLSSSVANGTTTPVITLNVPTASASNRGALSSTDWTTFNNKQNALSFTPYKFIQNSQTPVTGSVSETIVATATIAGNTFSTSDIMKISFIVTKTASTANMTLRMKINTSNTLSGATTIATFTFAASSLFAKFGRYFNLFGGNLYGYNFLSSAVDDSVTIATAGSSTAYNTANTLYFFFTVQLGNSGDTVTPNSCNITN